MKTSTVTNAFSNPVSITVVIILLAISGGLYMLQMIGVPVLVILIIISLLIGSFNPDRRPVGKSYCFANGEV